MTDISGLGLENTILLTFPDYDGYSIEVLPTGTFIGFSYTKELGYQFGYYGKRKITCSFTFTTRKELNSFLDFWFDRQASLKRFWLPCWYNEFELAKDILADDSSIFIKNIGLRYRNDGHIRIFLCISKGDWSNPIIIIRKATDIYLDSENNSREIILLDSSIPFNVSVDSVTVFGRCILVRFIENSLRLQWIIAREKECFVKTTCSFIELPCEYAEIET